MAMGALARLRAGGLAVPADIALAGFDDIGTLRDVYPPLTTVRLPLKRMGEMAAGLVLAEPPDAGPARAGLVRAAAAGRPRPRRGHPARQHPAAPAAASPRPRARRVRTMRHPLAYMPGPHQVRCARIWKALANR